MEQVEVDKKPQTKCEIYRVKYSNNAIFGDLDDCKLGIDATFYFIESKKQVKCIITDENLENLIELYIEEDLIKRKDLKSLLCSYKYDGRFIGLASCCPEDTYSEEHGRTLSLERALEKRANFISQLVYVAQTTTFNKLFKGRQDLETKIANSVKKKNQNNK